MDSIDSKSENPTHTTGNVEILHYPNYDVVLNKDYPNQDIVQQLLTHVQSGIPQDWTVYDEHFRTDPDATKNILVDNEDKPRFLAKIRKQASPQRLKRALDKLVPSDEHSIFTKKVEYAFNSVLNEFSLIRNVKEILASNEAQNIAIRIGFGNIRLIEPILALIERSSGRKIVFYEFIDTDTVFWPRTESNRIRRLFLDTKLDLFEKDLSDLFKRNGIYPHDLGPHQLMTPKQSGSIDNTLYLIDIEGYFRDPKNRFKSFKNL